MVLTRIGVTYKKNGYDKFLGFSKTSYTTETENVYYLSTSASPHPQTHFNVITNITTPIRVGTKREQLLRTIYLDDGGETTTGSITRTIHISNPIYVPVKESTIDSIEVAIKTFDDRLAPFTNDAITSLTLHFKSF